MNLSIVDFSKLKKIPLEWRIAFASSIGLHIVFLVVILLFTGVNYNSKKLPDVIDVDLTWLPAPATVKQTGVAKKKVKAVKKKSRRKIKKAVKKKKIVLPSKKKKRKKIKKQVAKSNDIINDAIKRLKKDLDKTKPDKLAERMKQLENEVKTTDKNRVDDRPIDQPSGKSGGQNSLSKRYSSYVEVAVQENWAFSENLAGGEKNLLTTISFIVMPDGEIRGVKIEKKSGNSYMDSAASMAVIKTSPVNPFPPGINEPHIEVWADFAPK